MNLVLTLPALIQERQLEESPNVRSLASQGNEDRHVYSIILLILSIRVEIDCPLKPADGEIVTGNVLADSHSFRERVPLNDKLVRSIHRLCDGTRPRGSLQKVLAGVLNHQIRLEFRSCSRRITEFLSARSFVMASWIPRAPAGILLGSSICVK